ncbi:MAG: VWA domain-containing protein [Verrucomicrobiae bacterium]|nr:VWA domain-containing protein [Verrucomicrobiae bacterium]
MATLLLSHLGFSQEQQKCLIILDASNSMSGYKKGTMKMRIAQQVINDLVTSMPQNIDLGLVVYGHRKKSDCEDIELMFPPGAVDRKSFIDKVNRIRANGKTPLTNSLHFAADTMKEYANGGGSVILLTDGLETCEGDPCEAVAALAASGINLTVHVVAFDLRADQASQLECIANASGGQFLNAEDASGLLEAMTVAITTVSEGPSSPLASAPAPAPQTVASPPAEPEPAPAVEEEPVKLTVPESVPVGSEFEVTWEGSGEANDYLTIVPDWAKDSVHQNKSTTNLENPVSVTALIQPQVAEVRYISSVTGNVRGRAKVTLTEVEATVSGPAQAVQGNEIEVVWTGPAYDGDFVTIVPKDAKEGTYEGFQYATRDKPTLEIRGLPASGPAEIRYVTGQDRRTLARADIQFVEALVNLSSVNQAVAGSEVAIGWEGPANQGDFITIVPKGTAEGRYQKFQYAQKGTNSVTVTAPMETGEAEIRYVAGNGRATLARIPIMINEAEVSLTAPREAVAGSEVPVEWVGPANKGDFITIVPAYAEESKYLKYAYAQEGKSPVEITAPMEAVEAEVRYLSGSGRQILARTAITIKAAEVTLTAPSDVTAGSMIKVDWTGPGNKGDFITVVSKFAEERAYGKLAYAQPRQNTIDLEAPMETGECEIRYLAGADRRTLARIPILVKAAEVTLKAADKATVGSLIKVEWQGPANRGDFITLVNKSAADNYYQRPVYVNKGQWTVDVLAPMTPGEMEIRYLAGTNRVPLQRIPITLEEAKITFELPETAPPGQALVFNWTGPQNQNDYITLVPAGSPDNQRGPIAYTNQGSPARINTPNEAGQYEMRYISGQGREVLGKEGIEITAQ